MNATSPNLIKHLPKMDICKICGYPGRARYLLIQIEAAGNATWNEGKHSQPCPPDQQQLIIQLDLQLGLTKYRGHDYRQSLSSNWLLWDCQTHQLCWDTRANAFALVKNQWKRDMSLT